MKLILLLNIHYLIVNYWKYNKSYIIMPRVFNNNFLLMTEKSLLNYWKNNKILLLIHLIINMLYLEIKKLKIMKI